MPVSTKPRKPYIQYSGAGAQREPKHNHERSIAKYNGAAKILSLIESATQGDVVYLPRTVHHMLAYNGVSV